MPAVTIVNGPEALVGLPDLGSVAPGAGLIVLGALITSVIPGRGKLIGLGAAGAGAFLLVRAGAEAAPDTPFVAAGAPEPRYDVTVMT